MKVTQTGTEFPIAEFNDSYGRHCYIKLSSLFYPKAIWLGSKGEPMHLTHDQVSELLPILQRFVETGDIIERPDNG